MEDEDKKRTVGLVTCFLDNYGACLQAYALQTVIRQMGFQCEIIRFVEPDGYNKSIDNSLRRKIKDSKLYYYYRCAKDKKYKFNHRVYGRRGVAFKQFREKYLIFGKEIFPTYQKLQDAKLPYSIFVCGSDQIWNPTFYGKCNPAYYLGFVPDGVRKISYAPSIGLSLIPEEYQSDFSKYVRRIDYLSCRESVGCSLIKQYSGRDAAHVLDPTLLLNRESWDVITRKKRRTPYVFCYLFGKHEYYTQLINRAQKFFKREVIYIPFYEEDISNGYKNFRDVGPEGFIGLIRDAKYVITDSFHATVFSILYKKNFSVLFRDSKSNLQNMNSRLTSLITKLKLKDRIVYEDDINDIEFNSISNYDEVYQELEKWRKSSLDFLAGALSDEKDM